MVNRVQAKSQSNLNAYVDMCEWVCVNISEESRLAVQNQAKVITWSLFVDHLRSLAP